MMSGQQTPSPKAPASFGKSKEPAPLENPTSSQEERTSYPSLDLHRTTLLQAGTARRQQSPFSHQEGSSRDIDQSQTLAPDPPARVHDTRARGQTANVPAVQAEPPSAKKSGRNRGKKRNNPDVRDLPDVEANDRGYERAPVVGMPDKGKEPMPPPDVDQRRSSERADRQVAELLALNAQSEAAMRARNDQAIADLIAMHQSINAAPVHTRFEPRPDSPIASIEPRRGNAPPRRPTRADRRNERAPPVRGRGDPDDSGNSSRSDSGVPNNPSRRPARGSGPGGSHRSGSVRSVATPATRHHHDGRILKFPDPPKLSDGLDPTYKSWVLLMEDKLCRDADLFLDANDEMAFVFGRTAGKASDHLQPLYRSTLPGAFTDAASMMLYLSEIYEDANEQQAARIAWDLLIMEPQHDIQSFRTDFSICAARAGIPPGEQARVISARIMEPYRTKLREWAVANNIYIAAMPIALIWTRLLRLQADRQEQAIEANLYRALQSARRPPPPRQPAAQAPRRRDPNAEAAPRRVGFGDLEERGQPGPPAAPAIQRYATPAPARATPRREATPAPRRHGTPATRVDPDAAQCYNCDETGHFARDCPHERRGPKLKEIEEDAPDWDDAASAIEDSDGVDGWSDGEAVDNVYKGKNGGA